MLKSEDEHQLEEVERIEQRLQRSGLEQAVKKYRKEIASRRTEVQEKEYDFLGFRRERGRVLCLWLGAARAALVSLSNGK